MNLNRILCTDNWFDIMISTFLNIFYGHIDLLIPYLYFCLTVRLANKHNLYIMKYPNPGFRI